MRTRTPTAVLEARGSFTRHPERRRERQDEPRPDTPLGNPPKRLSEAEKTAWREMQAEGFWLTSADAMMVEIAANLMSQQRTGQIDNPARTLLVSTLIKLGFGPTERAKMKVMPQKEEASPFDEFR